MLGFGELSSVQGDCGCKLPNGHAADEASDDEHGHVDCTGLEATANDGDYGAHEDCLATAKHVGKQHIEDGASDGATLEGGHNATYCLVVGIAEVLFEGGKRNGGSNDAGIILCGISKL